jgi:hypothetical protein
MVGESSAKEVERKYGMDGNSKEPPPKGGARGTTRVLDGMMN